MLAMIHVWYTYTHLCIPQVLPECLYCAECSSWHGAPTMNKIDRVPDLREPLFSSQQENKLIRKESIKYHFVSPMVLCNIDNKCLWGCYTKWKKEDMLQKPCIPKQKIKITLMWTNQLYSAKIWNLVLQHFLKVSSLVIGNIMDGTKFPLHHAMFCSRGRGMHGMEHTSGLWCSARWAQITLGFMAGQSGSSDCHLEGLALLSALELQEVTMWPEWLQETQEGQGCLAKEFHSFKTWVTIKTHGPQGQL